MANEGCTNCKHISKNTYVSPCVMCKRAFPTTSKKLEDFFELKIDVVNDVVNHPTHYCREGGIESIDEMVVVFGKEAVMNFCLCNVWKYRYRASDKNGEEDIKKSDWYMRKYKELKGEAE